MKEEFAKFAKKLSQQLVKYALNVLEWQPCNVILLNDFNLLRVNLVFTLKSAKVHYYYGSFLISYFNLLSYIQQGWLSLKIAKQPL